VAGLGKKIRKERQKRELTLGQLSELTGLSKGFLSQIERDLAQPSITTLKKLAFQFGISVVSFFSNPSSSGSQQGLLLHSGLPERDNRVYTGKTQVVPQEKRKSFTLPGSNVSYHLLTPDLNRQLEVMYLQISPNEDSGDEPMVDPPGEKFGLVLKGSLELRINNEVYHLKTGDSIYFSANSPHFWRGIGQDSIEVLWVLTPPWF